MSSTIVGLLLIAGVLIGLVGFRRSIVARRGQPRPDSTGESEAASGLSENTLPLVVLAMLEIVVFLLAITNGLGDPIWNVRLSVVLFGVTAAASAVGSLLGFLFGIPRFVPVVIANDAGASVPPSNPMTARLHVAASEPNQASGAPTFSYRPSTNLDDIADWLTKIIVGVGLTQLNSVGDALIRIGVAVRSGCVQACPTDAAVSSLVISGMILCFLFTYLWTRLHYNKLAARSDRDTVRILRMKQEQESLARFGLGGKARDARNAEVGELDATESDDPNKNRFGGLASNGDRSLTATVEPTASRHDLYRVTLVVTSTDPTSPLTGSVKFYLHPTFREKLVVQEAVNGVASLVLIAYGAFTVGVRTDGDRNELELDLAELKTAPPDFRNH